MTDNDENLELQKLQAIATKIKAYVDARSEKATADLLTLDNTFIGLNNFTGGLQKNGEDVVTLANVIQVGDHATAELATHGLLLVPTSTEILTDTSGQEQNDSRMQSTSSVCLDNS